MSAYTNEVEEMKDHFMEKYGKRLEAFGRALVDEMIQAHDGDSLALLPPALRGLAQAIEGLLPGAEGTKIVLMPEDEKRH